MKNNSWIRVGKADHFKSGEKTPVYMGNEQIFIYRNDKDWYAFETKCPHQGQTLEHARVVGNTLECNFHSVKFDLNTGRITDAGGYMNLPNLKVYNVKSENGEVLVNKYAITYESWDKGLEF